MNDSSPMKLLLFLIFAVSPFGAQAGTEFVQNILFRVPCSSAIKAAVAFSNDTVSIFRDEEIAAAYSFLLGIGANDQRDGSSEETFGRGLGAAAFFCERNPDISIYDVGRLISRN